jgi:hypothetical protein
VKQRAEEADRRRVNDLKAIARALHYRKELPGSFEILEQSGIPVRDPITKQLYTYRRKSDTQYDLCAIFDADDRNAADQDRNTFWRHGRELQCFPIDLNVNPAYSPY